MTVFRLTIDTHAGHFGETESSERTVLRAVLADVGQSLGSGRPLIGEQPITVNGTVVGSFSFGEGAHSFARRRVVQTPQMIDARAIEKALGLS